MFSCHGTKPSDRPGKGLRNASSRTQKPLLGHSVSHDAFTSTTSEPVMILITHQFSIHIVGLHINDQVGSLGRVVVVPCADAFALLSNALGELSHSLSQWRDQHVLTVSQCYCYCRCGLPLCGLSRNYIDFRLSISPVNHQHTVA